MYPHFYSFIRSEDHAVPHWTPDTIAFPHISNNKKQRCTSYLSSPSQPPSSRTQNPQPPKQKSLIPLTKHNSFTHAFDRGCCEPADFVELPPVFHNLSTSICCGDTKWKVNGAVWGKRDPDRRYFVSTYKRPYCEFTNLFAAIVCNG